MAFRSHKSYQNKEYSSENGVDDDILKTITKAISNIDLRINQLRREFHKSLDLNHPICDSTSIDLNKVPYDISDFKIETGSPIQATKHSGMGMEAVNPEGEQPPNLDLSLSLSLPGGELNDNNEESLTQSEISSISSQRSCMSLDMNTINEDLESSNVDPTKDYLPSLIVMGCTRCHIYVMVSEAEPKCPNCMNYVLLDMFRESPAKKSRRN